MHSLLTWESLRDPMEEVALEAAEESSPALPAVDLAVLCAASAFTVNR